MRITGVLALAMLGCGSSPIDAPDSSPASGDSGIAVDGGGSDGAADSGACTNPTDMLVATRRACTFKAGAHVKDTLGIDDATRAAIPVQYVVVLMKENRGFDHLLGKLHDIQPDVEAIPPTFQNLDKKSMPVTPFHETTTCVHDDPAHQWAAMHAQVNGGKMDGFVTSAASTTPTDGHFVLGYYDKTDVPFYYWLASTFALNDRHFASVRSGTWPDRNFLLLGTADGVQSTGAGYPDPTTPTIFDLLDKANVTWGAYTDQEPFEGTLNWPSNHVGVHKFADFIAALDAGTLPHVAFVDSIENVEDEHPTADVQKGEAWTRNIYEHAVKSPLWPKLAVVWTYDEAGGFFDHVPPPSDACIARPVFKDMPFFELGVRVPLAVMSPWARPHYVSHIVQEHTAITRFIETLFDLPALTARDANSDALLDMFDFCNAAMMTPPAAPASGTGGCN
jgi:phospholipase C